MRALLDAHISARRIGQALRDRGHDVVVADEQRHLDGTSDADLLELATQQRRIMVTFDAKDFARITRRWAEAQRSHAGCVILVGLGHADFGAVIHAVDSALRSRPDPHDWHDLTAFVSHTV